MTGATIAVRPALSDQPCELTPSRSLESKNESSESYTSNVAPLSGLANSEHGWLSEQEPREARRQAYDAGIKRGAASIFSAPVMEQISLELTVTRVTLDAMSAAAE